MEYVVKEVVFCGEGGCGGVVERGFIWCGCGGPRAMILLNDVLRFAA